MRKESLKKNGAKNGTVDDSEHSGSTINDSGDTGILNGDAIDPLDGADQTTNMEFSKKRSKKTKESVVEVDLPLITDDLSASAGGKDANLSSIDDGNDGDAAEDYEVDDIVDYKIEKKKAMYLVRWKNYGAESDTWEPEESLSCGELIEKYHQDHPYIERKPTSTKKAKATPKPKKEQTKRASAAGSGGGGGGGGDENYEVEDIVDHKKERGKTIFLIRWKGWSAADDTWEPESSLTCPAIVAKYKKTHMTTGGGGKTSTPAKKRAASTGSGKKASNKKGKADQEDYEVEMIVNDKTEKGKKIYLVRWKGWSPQNDSWEPESSLNCPELIKKYKDLQEKKQRNSSKRVSKKKQPKYVDESDDEEVIPAKKGRKGAAAATNEQQDDYEVEGIVDHKTERGKKFYLVKWKGWAASSNTWEPESSLSCPDIVKKYLATKKVTKKSTPTKKATIKKATKPANKKKSTSNDSNEEPDWEVEEITDVRYNDDGSKEYLIRWKGCDSSQDTWEPESNVDCPALVNKFLNKSGNPKKRSRT